MLELAFKMDLEVYKIELEKVNAQAEEKAKELTARFGRKVTPFVFVNPDDLKDFVIGFIKDPERLDKMRAFDLYEQSRSQSGDHLLRTSLIHEESDKRILDERPENDPIYMGAVNFAIDTVSLFANQFKKK